MQISVQAAVASSKSERSGILSQVATKSTKPYQCLFDIAVAMLYSGACLPAQPGRPQVQVRQRSSQWSCLCNALHQRALEEFWALRSSGQLPCCCSCQNPGALPSSYDIPATPLSSHSLDPQQHCCFCWAFRTYFQLAAAWQTKEPGQRRQWLHSMM
jgi:hypothetical protein